MRKILRRLRKGIKTACLTALLATCWQVGRTAPVSAATVTLQFSGTVSPAFNDLSHLFLIYGTGYSSWYTIDVVKLGDFSAGQSTSFMVFADVEDEPDFRWYTAGLYGDISDGQYVEGLNGVTLGIDGAEGHSWATYFPVPEETVFNLLLNDESGYPIPRPSSWSGWHEEWNENPEISGSSILFDFTTASNNGQISFESQIVPEPVTIVLLGAGGLFVLYRRRKE